MGDKPHETSGHNKASLPKKKEKKKKVIGLANGAISSYKVRQMAISCTAYHAERRHIT